MFKFNGSYKIMCLFMGQNKWFGTSHLEPKMKIFFFVYSFLDMATILLKTCVALKDQQVRLSLFAHETHTKKEKFHF